MDLRPSVQLSDAELALVRELLQNFLPGVAVWAFGSRARNTARRTSDLDLVVFASPAQRAAVADLHEAFEQSDLTFTVDLHIWSQVPGHFQSEIQARYVELAASTE